MLYSAWRDYRLSRLMLGTVQFGMPYGVANRTGQPDYRDVVAMLAAAIEGGVNCLDTAAAYGTSEEVLGRALQELGAAEQMVVVTKVRPLTDDERADTAQASRAIIASLQESRRRLRLECLPIVLFHREADAAFRDVLEDLQRQGWLRHIGVSCENCPGAAAEFMAHGVAEALQLAASVLDRRHQRNGVFAQAAARGVALFIRSVYLQGLLLMAERDVPPALRDVLPARQQLATIAREAGMTLAELALRFMLSQHGVTCVLTGVESLAQVRENLAIFEKGPLPRDLEKRIELATLILPDALLTPGLWPK